MHRAAYDYVAAHAGQPASVIEIGSRDLNGSVRPLFPGATYVGLDVVDGPGVDVVFDPAVPPPVRVRSEVVVCCEVLEHVADWPDVLAMAARYLRADGRLIVTAAGPGRRPHSGITGRRTLEPGEHYENIDPRLLAVELERAGFIDIEVDVAGCDVRAHARRRVRTVVGIPFIDETDRTAEVIEAVLADPAVDVLFLADNGSTDPRLLEYLDRVILSPRVVLNRGPALEAGGSLYALWNEVVRTAQAIEPGDPVNVALLNNDVRFLPGTIEALADALRSSPSEVAAVYPDWNRRLTDGHDVAGLTVTSGAWSKGGLSGFAFLFAGELMGPVIPYFDERYRLIHGDGDFVEDLEAAGLTAARVDGLPLEHDKSTTLNAQREWTGPVKAEDTLRRKAKVATR